MTDPAQGRRPTDMPVTITIPTHTLPTQAQGKPSTTPGEEGNTNQGPQAVTSLVLTVTKVEVHLAQLGIPGTKNENEHGRPIGTPMPKDNQNIDKWETLNIGGTKTIDLMQLAKANALSSLGITNLASGRYTEVRLYFGSATAVLSDGTKVGLTIPGKANIVRVVEPFVIDSGKTTSLVMAFDAQNSALKSEISTS